MCEACSRMCSARRRDVMVNPKLLLIRVTFFVFSIAIVVATQLALLQVIMFFKDLSVPRDGD